MSAIDVPPRWACHCAAVMGRNGPMRLLITRLESSISQVEIASPRYYA